MAARLILVWTVKALQPGTVPTWEAAVQVGGVVLFVVGAFTQWPGRIWADEAGICAPTQLGRRRRITWSEVRRVELRGYWGGLGVLTLDGRWVRLMRYHTYERRAAEYATQLEAYRWERQRALGLA